MRGIDGIFAPEDGTPAALSRRIRDSEACGLFADIEECPIYIIHHLRMGSISPRDVAQCSDCHVILVEPNESRGLTVHATGCHGMMNEVFAKIFPNWDRVKTIDESQLALTPMSAENQQAGVIRFSVRITWKEFVEGLESIRNIGRPVIIKEVT